MATVKTRVLIVSDTHCAQLTKDGRHDALDSPFKPPLPKADVAIHCGDLTHKGKFEEYEQTLDMLKNIDAPVKLVIAGNHDLSLDHDFVMTHFNKYGEGRQPQTTREEAQAQHDLVTRLWLDKTGRAREEGITFLDEGDHIINLANGASLKVYASPYTPEFHDWGFAYQRNQDRFNEPQTTFSDCENIAVKPITSKSFDPRPYDIIVTHGPPKNILDPTFDGFAAGCVHLLRAITRARPLIHCFGHIHEGWGANRVKWSAKAEDKATKKTDSKRYQKTTWQKAIESSHRVRAISEDDRARHAAYADLSSSSSEPLQAGKETFFVNAAIMNVRYKPVNAPWLIDIDLPQVWTNNTTDE